MAQARKKTDAGLEFTLLQHVKYGLRESGFLLLAGVALFFLTALLSFNIEDPAWTHTGTSRQITNLGGIVGAWIADVSLYFFGYLAYLLPIGIVFCGWRLFHRGLLSALDGEVVFFRVLGALVALAAGCGFLSLSVPPIVGVSSAGGLVGDLVSAYLVKAFGLFGARLFQVALFLAGVNLATGISWVGVLDMVGAAVMAVVGGVTIAFMRVSGIFQRTNADKPGEKTSTKTLKRKRADAGEDSHLSTPKKQKPKQSETKAKRRVEPVINQRQTKATADNEKSWSERISPVEGSSRLPDLDLLDEAEQEQSGYSSETLSAMSERVEELLRDFGVDVQVVAIEPGPVITRFELNPAPGVKVSRISNLAKDLARGLSVISVRVVEVIPGKSVIGLEIPNQHRQVVSLREVFDSGPYQDATSPLTLALGKDIAGKPIVANLAKMPHLLIAGTTGSGKSVGVNAMLLSMLFKARAEDVRMILVDPKMLELSVYEDIPHLLAPVVTDMKDAANALRWCVGEMERRYRLMAALKVRNIAGFNKIVTEAIATGKPIQDPLYVVDPSVQEQTEQPAPTLEPLPFIVVVIDELADMMMIVGKKVEELIARLAQKARASGIHLILATQRPSVDVITGLIKANVPTRMAFQVSSKVDSRTILDQMGAEALLGHGDMLFLPPGTAFPQRVHGAFVADHEVNKVVAALKTSGKPDYSDSILQEPSDGFIPGLDPAGSAGDASESDPLYDRAVQIVLESRKASISYVQRRLKIGYNRAARMMEDMEAAGVVGSLQNNGAREILVPGSDDG